MQNGAEFRSLHNPLESSPFEAVSVSIASNRTSCRRHRHNTITAIPKVRQDLLGLPARCLPFMTITRRLRRGCNVGNFSPGNSSRTESGLAHQSFADARALDATNQVIHITGHYGGA